MSDMKGKMSREQFKEQLDNEYSWPALYMFKFIVPNEQEGEVKALFPYNELTSKASKNGKYISVTAQVMMNSSEAIVQIYEKAYKIEGIISL